MGAKDSIGTAVNTRVVDLFSPANRFVSASRLHGRLHRWWLLLRRYAWVVGGVGAVVLGLAYSYVLASGPTYESKARLWLTGKINMSGDQLYTEELVNFLGTQAALLRSPTIQRRALARLRAGATPGEAPVRAVRKPGWSPSAAAGALYRRLFGSAPAPRTDAQPPIPFDVTVQEGAKSSTLEIRVTGAEPLSTRRYLECLTEDYLTFRREALDKVSVEAATSLNGGAAQLKSEVEATQAKLQTFQASNDVVFLHQQGSSAESYLASLNRQLAALRTERKLLESLKPEQWLQTDAVRGGAGAGDEPGARQAIASLVEAQTALFRADQEMHLLMAKREDLSRHLRPAHPKIIKLDQDIAGQEEIVRVARDEALKQLNLRREALDLQIRNLEAAFEDWNLKAVAASRKMAAYEEIRQTLQRQQTAYDKTLGLVQTIDLGKRVDQANVGVLDPASVALPTHRNLMVMGLAVALGLGLSGALLYVLGLVQDHFASPTEVADELGERVLGQIPSIVLRESGGLAGVHGPARQRFEFLEAFRNLRGAMLFLNLNAPGPKAIAIASSVPGEGKSTVALYLAATMAKGNARVLLVDGDMRRPTLHLHFNLPYGPGLGELLAGEASAPEAIVPTGVPNLALLPAGYPKEDPGELVLSPAWAEFLATAKAQYDYVLVDTPPVAATEDAAALVPKADGVLFIVRAVSTSARTARSALDALRQRRAQVLGLVFNRAVASPYEPGYYQPYARAYDWTPKRPGAAGRLLAHAVTPVPVAKHVS